MSGFLSSLPYLVSAWIFFAGLFGIVRSRNLLHMAVCVVIMQSSTYILLLSIGFRSGATAPIFYGISPTTLAVDPVVQALVLTDVVVETVVLALLLAIAVQIHDCTGELDPNRIAKIKG
ncbi:MAG TPA: NADH-quinone oxidoreductase subunit K [Terriglobia bacterium]|nr:NADH-quinone oxidoreductase subunit K [Terriglobia bacterium]